MSSPRKRQTLTKRQQEIYEFLRDLILTRGYGPTVREIGAHFKIKSPNGVMCHLKALERKGLIFRESNMSRAIKLADPPRKPTCVPLLGTAATGKPIASATSRDQLIEFDGLFEGSDLTCLRIRGNSYAAIGIFDGDNVLIARDAPMAADALVAALDDRHQVVFWKVVSESRELVPAMPGGVPTVRRQMLGVVTGVIRDMKGAVRHPDATPDADSPPTTSMLW